MMIPDQIHDMWSMKFDSFQLWILASNLLAAIIGGAIFAVISRVLQRRYEKEFEIIKKDYQATMERMHREHVEALRKLREESESNMSRV